MTIRTFYHVVLDSYIYEQPIDETDRAFAIALEAAEEQATEYRQVIQQSVRPTLERNIATALVDLSVAQKRQLARLLLVYADREANSLVVSDHERLAELEAPVVAP